MKILLFTALFSACALPLFSQTDTIKPPADTLFFKNENGFIVAADREEAEGYCLKLPFNPNPYVQKIRFLGAETSMAEYECYDRQYLNEKSNVRSAYPVKNGRYEEWYLSGQKRVSCQYRNDKLDGEFTAFHPGGGVKRVEKWKNGEWQEGKCFDEQGNEVAYCSYQEPAGFVGGLTAMYSFIGGELQYPKYARKKNIEGVVYVGFIVEKDGSIGAVWIVKGVEEHLDEEAMRVVQAMPKWKPGRFEGEAVRFKFTLPMRFRLE